MPSPTATLTTQRPDLAASFEEYDLESSRAGFIAHQILPTFETASQAGTFGKIPLEALLANRETRRAPGAGYSRDDWEFETDSFATEEHGAEEPVDDREAAIYKNYFDAEQFAAARAKDVVLRNAERRVADMVFNATTYTGAALTTAIVNEWDDLANATPITDVEAATRKIWDGTGLWGNALILNKHVFRNLRRCAQIVDLLKYNGIVDVRPSKITPSMIASILDLDYVLVGEAAKNTAKKGQTATIGKVWSDEYVSVARICTSGDIREPGLGRTFYFTGDDMDIDGRVETYREEQTRSQIARFRHDVQEKLLYVSCAHLLSNATT